MEGLILKRLQLDEDRKPIVVVTSQVDSVFSLLKLKVKVGKGFDYTVCIVDDLMLQAMVQSQQVIKCAMLICDGVGGDI